MATTTIPWGDGSGGNIYLTYPSASGDQTVSVTSDANTGAARSKVVSFTSGVGSIVRQLTVSQDAGTITPVLYNYLIFDGTAYIETDYVIPSDASIRFGAGKESLKVMQPVFSASGTNGGYIMLAYGGSTNTNRRQMMPYYDSSSALATSRYLVFSTVTYTFFMTSKRFGWGNTAYTYTKGSLHPDGGLSFGKGSQPYTGMLQPVRIYGSETQNLTNFNAFSSYTPIATFWPCTYNGQAGLWYVEQNKFYGNTAGSGTLTAADSI